jgi:hypothetical protein
MSPPLTGIGAVSPAGMIGLCLQTPTGHVLDLRMWALTPATSVEAMGFPGQASAEAMDWVSSVKGFASAEV